MPEIQIESNLMTLPPFREIVEPPGEVPQPMIVPPANEQALRLMDLPQRLFFWIGALCLVFSLAFAWHATLIWVNGAIAVFYILVTLYKLGVITASVRSGSQLTIAPEEIAALEESALPRYTILAPVYKEAAVMPHLIQSLEALDYPREKLEILVLLEENDPETIEAFERLDRGAPFQAVLVRESYPNTKPKACDVGLALATGEYLVIYDAEDRPEPDQLKKAVAGFARCPEEVACLQAKLNFYNRDQNLFSKWFTVEYSMWYDLFLPGLGSFDAPIPLGGTSNHFRRETLVELGGWDPYNVAEDCDLGIRLHLKGYRTRVLDSTTWEEACSRPFAWIRQRSRWVKGYMQTFFVHTRGVFGTMRGLGLKGSAHFLLLTLGMFFTYLINPFYWLLTFAWIFFRTETVGEFFPLPIFLMGFFCLFLGNFAIIYAGMLGCCRRRYFSLVKYALVVPPYWAMISVGAWKALWQLFFKPHYWEKTQHGVDVENG